MNSKLIYKNLCENRKGIKESYKPKSGLHKHHIIPKHMGGADDESNFTYLTPKEHQIAHYLLWRIYKNVNDLRSMKMLGARLTLLQRKTIGEWCRDNKIGFHGATSEQKAEWCKKGLETQKLSGDKNSFYWWSTPEGRKERASLGGKKSIQSDNNPWKYWASAEGQKERASLGGKSHRGKKCMYKPGDKSFKRIKPEDIEEKLAEGYIFGSPHKPNKKYL